MVKKLEPRDGSIKLEKTAAVYRRPNRSQSGRMYEEIETAHCFYVSPNILENISRCSTEKIKEHLNSHPSISSERKEVTLEKAGKYLSSIKETIKLAEELQKQRGLKIESILEGPIDVQSIFRPPSFVSHKKVKLYDARRKTTLPGYFLTRSEIAKSKDQSIKNLWDVSCKTCEYYYTYFDRDSYDNLGTVIKVTDNFGHKFANAYWDGKNIVFGRGDGKIFGKFSDDNNVYIHENGHALVQETVNLRYQDEAGALNESCADVFAKTLEKILYGIEDWLVGDKVLLGPGALRNMQHPGTAYNEDEQPLLGNDPQPDHMSKYVKTRSDNGGVHINSGIPNRLYVLAAEEIGLRDAITVWYRVLNKRMIGPYATFKDFKKALIQAAEELDEDKNGKTVAAIKKACEVIGL